MSRVARRRIGRGLLNAHFRELTGTHPAVIASRLGHTSVQTILDVSGHLNEGLDRGAADALQSPWEPLHVDALWSRKRSRGIGLEGP